jgi:hypothetical protein
LEKIDRQSYYTSHAYYERAIAKLEMGNVKGAKEDIDRAIQFSLDRQTLFDINKAMNSSRSLSIDLDN